MNDQQRFEHLIQSRHPLITMVTEDESYALRLVRDTALNLGRDLRMWVHTRGVGDGLMSDMSPAKATEHPAAALWYLASPDSPMMAVMLDLTAHLDDPKVLRLLRDLIARFEQVGSQLILIDHLDELPPVIRAQATRFEISLPDEKELDDIVRDTLREYHRQNRIEVDITRRDLATIIRNLHGLTRRQAEQIIIDCVAEDRCFNADDINTVLARKRQAIRHSGLLEFVETPVDLSEIGGLHRLKTWLSQRQGAVTDEAKSYGLTAPRGVLMLGVQGAGKSLCAKAIATAWQRPLLRMDVGALYDRYVGESERRLRDSLNQAEHMAPIILWIDEIEKAFASSASRSTDGGLSQRMFGTLLTWMQEHVEPVFLVATANDIEALPPELLRKGRFDEIFFVDLPTTETRKIIFSIHLRKRDRDPSGFDLDALAHASEGYSGAEIEQGIISALHECFARRSEVDTAAVIEAIKASPPLSVTMAERVQTLRAWAKNRCVPAE